ncbi:MAG: RidA family protein [Verrucomicrobiae bacterium]|nr:RidA family protein [Verrucomicrobiae bacterium]
MTTNSANTSETIAARLSALGLTLPPAPAAVGAYAATIISTGGLLAVSGQLSRRGDGTLITGRVGETLSLEDGIEAARCSGLNILAQAATALGDLSRITRTLRLNGFIQTAPDFTAHATVLNGASDLMAAVLGEAGIHTRIAVGAHTLPLGVATEIDALFEVRV